MIREFVFITIIAEGLYTYEQDNIHLTSIQFLKKTVGILDTLCPLGLFLPIIKYAVHTYERLYKIVSRCFRGVTTLDHPNSVWVAKN